MSETEPLTFILIGVFLVLSAFFSSSEAAFLSLQRTRLAHLVSTGAPGAKRVAAMVREPERLLSTILLGNNLVNVAFTSLLTVVVVSALGSDREGQGVLIATVHAQYRPTTGRFSTFAAALPSKKQKALPASVSA